MQPWMDPKAKVVQSHGRRASQGDLKGGVVLLIKALGVNSFLESEIGRYLHSEL